MRSLGVKRVMSWLIFGVTRGLYTKTKAGSLNFAELEVMRKGRGLRTHVMRGITFFHISRLLSRR